MKPLSLLCLMIVVLAADAWTCSSSFIGQNSITAYNINKTLYVDGQKYPTLQAAFADCGTGCIIDLSGSTGTSLSLGSFDPGAVPVEIRLGPHTYSVTQITVRTGLHVIGCGKGCTSIDQTRPGVAPFVLPSKGPLIAQHVLLQGFNLQAASESSTDAISMVAAPAGGLWYSTFQDLTIGSSAPFGRNALRFDSAAGGSPPATNQFISIRDVFAFRAANAPPVLVIQGAYSGQFSIDASQFDAPYSPRESGGKNNCNIYVGDGGSTSWMPYSINMHNVTSQWSWGPGSVAICAYGVANLLVQGSHFEGDNGVFKGAIGAGGHGNWGTIIRDSYIATTAINGGKGFLANVDANTSLLFQNNGFTGTPDHPFTGTTTYVTSDHNWNLSSGGPEPW